MNVYVFIGGSLEKLAEGKFFQQYTYLLQQTPTNNERKKCICSKRFNTIPFFLSFHRYRMRGKMVIVFETDHYISIISIQFIK